MFINSVLKKEQEVYRSEGVEWVHINFQDNAPIYTMIEVASTRERGREGERGGREIRNMFPILLSVDDLLHLSFSFIPSLLSVHDHCHER